ncbi:amino acid permease [Texcoconibacillus texcoconensis]|uniref:L-asparagine transporter-like permease n=1 Tax=Texcoconibacillus texcoconensis TaxID=1095777 RepID=A0A840QUY6_9BACI|nr:amino acid permease [Texcoconibacillus texcoconensis]MBB5175113.1 L-asparagine transporter-like permease [Texcoconibacillus texcoconensis]
MGKSNEQNEKPLKWWQLTLLGIACTIGTGFFLGSSIAINMTGPSVIFSFAIAAIATYFVYEALAKMTTEDPQEGSFRSYAKKAYGRWAGFTSGWVYWASEILIIGSQMTALAIFSQLWFPNMPLWILATIYAVLAMIVILCGSKAFDRVENILAVLKASAIVMFIIIAVLALLGLLGGNDEEANAIPKTFQALFPNGLTGFLPSLIFGFYGFAGIEIIGLLAVRLEEKKDALKAGKLMFFTLGVIYMVSIGLAILLVSWDTFTHETSPFITSLEPYNIPFISHIFNAVFIIAGFSTMVASLFAVISILVTLAEDQDAPSFLSKKFKDKYALPAMGLTTLVLAVSVVMSVVMPDNIYEYFTTAAGLMLLYNWFFIIGSYGRLHELTIWANIKRLLGFSLVLLAIVGTVFHQTSRPGFFVSLAFIVVISIVTFIMRHFWKKKSKESSNPEPKT